MSNQTFNQATAELDATNRAAKYFRDAQEQGAQAKELEAQARSTDFQQMLLLKNIDQAHAMDRLSAEQRHEMSMENKRSRAALDLRKLELERQGSGLSGTGTATGLLDSKWLLPLVIAALPFVIPPLIRRLPGRHKVSAQWRRSHSKHTSPRRRWRSQRQRHRKFHNWRRPWTCAR